MSRDLISHPRRFHLIEKIQVQLAATVALLIVYFAWWPALRPADPRDPMTFIAAGSYAEAALFVGTIWLFAAVAAIVTLHARPEGALMAALIGAGGASLRSARIRGLLWMWESRLDDLYMRLILEMLLLTAVLAAAAVIVDLVRRGISRVRPQWLGKNPVGSSQPAHDDADDVLSRERCGYSLLLFSNAPKARVRQNARTWRTPGCLGLGLAIAIPLLLVLMQSSDRGQILFALLVSFAVAAGVAHQVFPTPRSIAAWGMPLVVAIVFYALAAWSAPSGNGAWMRVPLYAQPLPIDWLTAGCGGALIGFWISERVHETRFAEMQEAE